MHVQVAEQTEESDLDVYACGPHGLGDNLMIGARCGDEDIRVIVTATGVDAIRHCGADATTGHGDYFIPGGGCYACAVHAAVKLAVANTLPKPPTPEQCAAYGAISALAFDIEGHAPHTIERQLVIVDGAIQYRRVIHEPRQDTP